ncbi:MAG: DUF4335 domain-containing protein [Cyanobacteria bacterium P01_D01_bin.44]
MTSAPRLATQHYTANGCTLEITAAESPLSRWSDRSLLKHIRFKLWLHPPDIPSPSLGISESEAIESATLIAQGNQLQLETLSQTVQTYVQIHLGHGELDPSPLTASNLPTASHWPLGQKHQLAGSLPLSLSTLELFDVAEALQQYEQSNVNLPALSDAAPRRTSASRRRPRSTWLWGSSVAAAMLLAVGVTATLRNTANVTTTAETAGAGSVTAESDANSSDANSNIANGDAADTQIAKATPPSTGTGPTTTAESDEASDPGETQPTLPTNQPPSTPSPSPSSSAQRLPQTATPTPNNRSTASAPRPATPPASQAPSRNTEPEQATASSDPNPSIERAPSAPAPDLRTRIPASRPQQRTQEEALHSAPPTDRVADADQNTESDQLLADSAPSAEASESEQSTFSSGIPASTDITPTLDAVAVRLEGQLLERELLGQSQADSLSESSAEAPADPSVSTRREAEPRLYEMVLNPNGRVTSLTPLNAAAAAQPWAIAADPIVAPFERDRAVTLLISVDASNQVTVVMTPAQSP